MKPYELTYIISSDITSEEADTVKKEYETFVQNNGGVVIKSEKTVPQSLSYPIKKHSSGYFATLEFQIEESKIKEMKAVLEKDARVLRHFMVVKKPVKVMKERRTRKPLSVLQGEGKIGSAPQMLTDKDKHKGEKVELKDIEKKLDEILSE